ncbi:MAG: hypothetical protein U0936_25715 [Planctomycetaceae bacterium]
MTSTSGRSATRRRFLLSASLAIGAVTGNGERRSLAASESGSFKLDPSWPAEFPGILSEPCQVAGVAIAKNGSILVLNRGENHWMPSVGYRQERIQKPAVLVFDNQQGNLVGSWGEGLFVMPHQIRVDGAGNIWIVDCGRDKVFKFDPNGSMLMEVGGPEIGFRKPTDVVVLSDGVFVVSDGYTNARVAVFSPEGQAHKSVGAKRETSAGVSDASPVSPRRSGSDLRRRPGKIIASRS